MFVFACHLNRVTVCEGLGGEETRRKFVLIAHFLLDEQCVVLENSVYVCVGTAFLRA